MKPFFTSFFDHSYLRAATLRSNLCHTASLRIGCLSFMNMSIVHHIGPISNTSIVSYASLVNTMTITFCFSGASLTIMAIPLLCYYADHNFILDRVYI